MNRAVKLKNGFVQVNILSTENGDQYFIKEGDDGEQLLTIDGEEGVVTSDDQSGQVVAQLVEAGEPAPGGQYFLNNHASPFAVELQIYWVLFNKAVILL